ncbi:MAG: PDR/VanB family oxidoreductase [Beijerinckiaceae bacterium]|nr:PDR/VanB family oxidoreductase [Beijerinckiaceae bacterium]
MSDPAPVLDVVIARRVALADGIIGLELRRVDGTPLPPFEAGAHVDVHVSPGLIRQYSICNDPADPTHYRLGILEAPDSRGGSAEIHRAFIEGRQIKIGLPRNNFRLLGTGKTVLLAGGIGITPLLSMARHLKRHGGPFHLHYCTRARSRAAFLAEIEGSLAPHASIHFDEGPASQHFAAPKIAFAPTPDTHAYVCGPQGFMDCVIGEMRQLGWAESNIHTEYFNAAVDGGGDAFEVIAKRSGATFKVPAGQTAAEVLIAHGIDVPLSCEQGVCGTCLTRVLSGIPDHRDMFQTNAEKAANSHMALCCSRALTPTIALDI